MTVLTFVVDRERVDVDLAALSGLEWRLARLATGLRQAELIALLTDDFEAQAAVVWLRLRHESDQITYAQVLERFSYNTSMLVGADLPEPEEADDVGR